MCRETKAGWVPSSIPNPYRDFIWWDTGVHQPFSNIQVDQKEQPKRILDSRGKPIPRRVHRFGFQARMTVE